MAVIWFIFCNTEFFPEKGLIPPDGVVSFLPVVVDPLSPG
jgi:hypothetical protein